MQVSNIEKGIERALRAYLIERGVAPEAADAKVQTNLAAAVALWKSTVGPGPIRDLGDLTERATPAYAAVKDWSKSL